MANFEAITASNSAKVKKGVTALLEKYNLIESHYEVEIELNKYKDRIEIYGYEWFCIYDPKSGEYATDEFLKELAPYLQEELIIQCIGHEKCRYPLSFWQITVQPNGEIEKISY